MICGTCQKKMVVGNLLGDRYALKWMPEDEKMLLGTFANNSIVFKKSSFIGRPKVEAFVCTNCNSMHIDMNGKIK